jgi:hypothetical protein
LAAHLFFHFFNSSAITYRRRKFSGLSSSISFLSSSFIFIPPISDARQVRVAKLPHRAGAWGFCLQHIADIENYQCGKSGKPLPKKNKDIYTKTESEVLPCKVHMKPYPVKA